MTVAERLAGARSEHPPTHLSQLSSRLVVPAYKSAAVVARALPAPIAEAFGRALGAVLSYTMRDRRAVVECHQRRVALGPMSQRDLDRQVRRTFDSYARYWVDAFRLSGRSTEAIDAGIDASGAHHVDEALARGKGAILAMPHVGAWDYGGAWVAHHWPLTVVAERLEPPALFEWFCQQRAANRMRVVALGPEASPVLLRALRANEVVGLLCERDLAGGGVEVEFFGERTTFPAGPATLSLRTGAPILPNAAFQNGRRVRGEILPPLVYERTGTLRADVQALTQLLAREFESLIREAPEQWHVLQPLWPSDRASTS